MKIPYTLIAFTIIVAFGLAACGNGDEATTRDAEDTASAADETDDNGAEENGAEDDSGLDIASLSGGWYRAAQEYDPEEDWRNIVMVEVSDGEIVDATWTAAPLTGGMDKMTSSMEGEYGMEEVAQSPWHEQAQATIDHLLETQDPTDVEFTDDGKTDAISGATITVSYFFDLAEEALSGSPDGFGSYEDGVYRGEAEAGDEWQDVVHITVVDGYIVSVHWAPEPLDDQGMDKYEYSLEGEYGMESASDWAWHEHADAVAEFVIENQAVDAIELDDDGKTDAISGATVSLDGFYDAAQEALAQAE
ncbi:MAG: FMN-binding protein [Spirochaetia bacterium]